MTRIAHLIDDTSAGGVTHYLAFLQKHPAMAAMAEHEIVPVSRIRAGAARVKADIIVSHLTVSWRGLPGLMALRARYPLTPLVHVEHSYCEGFVSANVSERRRFHTLLRCAYALFDRIVAVSAAQAEWLSRAGLVQDEALATIPPSVDLSAFAALAAPTGPVRRIGALGRLHPQKGFDLLIFAFRELHDEEARLEIFGDGPQRHALEMLARDDPRITFHGHTAPETALAQCDIVAMPSRWEPYGLVAQEARVAGRQVLQSGRDGLSDQLAHGGIRVPELSVAAWTRALCDAMETEAGTPRPSEAAAIRQTVDGWALLLNSIHDGRGVPAAKAA